MYTLTFWGEILIFPKVLLFSRFHHHVTTGRVFRRSHGELMSDGDLPRADHLDQGAVGHLKVQLIPQVTKQHVETMAAKRFLPLEKWRKKSMHRIDMKLFS